jgi:hypothetical protein
MSAPWSPPARPQAPRHDLPSADDIVAQALLSAVNARLEGIERGLADLEAAARFAKRQFVVGCLVGLALALVLL